ncbi:MAG: hypothetical protein WCG61_07050 [Chlorobium sp.]
MSESQSSSEICPFIPHALPGCKVQVITGKTIPAILECCGDRFAVCPLYRNKLADGDSIEFKTPS